MKGTKKRKQLKAQHDGRRVIQQACTEFLSSNCLQIREIRMADPEKELKELLDWLRENGKEYTIDDPLDALLGGERFCYDTRKRAVEASFIIRENPKLKKLITSDLEKYFEAYTL